jgi:hypothetical protein
VKTEAATGNERLEAEEEERRKSRLIFNPYNKVYEKCVRCLLDKAWEKRHASSLVLRGFAREPRRLAYLGFVIDV